MATASGSDTSTPNTLVSIGKGIYLSKPVDNGKSSGTVLCESSQPTIILIFGWMGARVTHLLKYVAKYDELYPAATKILVRSEASAFWTTGNKRKASLEPILEVLAALGCLPPGKKAQVGAPLEPLSATPPRILVHTFSNGGCMQLTTLSNLISDRFSESSYPTTNLPATAVVLDSCPGDGGLQATQKAFLTAVRNPILRRIAALLITILYIFGVVTARLFGSKGIVVKMKEDLNKHLLLPWFSKATPRLYLYSKADELIPHIEVEAHAADARKAGLVGRLEKFEDSPHVAHVRTDPDRYWGAIQDLWNEASKGRQS